MVAFINTSHMWPFVSASILTGWKIELTLRPTSTSKSPQQASLRDCLAVCGTHTFNPKEGYILLFGLSLELSLFLLHSSIGADLAFKGLIYILLYELSFSKEKY